MLSNHVQSMFEYLAPRRGGGGGGGGGGQGAGGGGGGPHIPQPQHHGKPPNNDGYKEMVYWENELKENKLIVILRVNIFLVFSVKK